MSCIFFKRKNQTRHSAVVMAQTTGEIGRQKPPMRSATHLIFLHIRKIVCERRSADFFCLFLKKITTLRCRVADLRAFKKTVFRMRYTTRVGWTALLFSFFLVQKMAAQQPTDVSSLRIRSIGPAAMSGRITAIATDPTDANTIYAGAASGGVWRSRSGGTRWEPIFDGGPTQGIGSIAVNPRNPDDIWVGTGEGNPRNSQNFGAGIFRSLDGGKTWKCMGLEQTRTIHRVIVHRDNPDVVWAASLGSAYGPNDERGVFKTTDGGRTWRKALFVNDLTGCAELVVDPKNPNKLIAAMWEYRRWPWFFKSGGKGSGLYVSHDGGDTWTPRSSKDGLPEGDLGRLGLAIAPSNPDVVYALVEAKENALYKSTDGGQKWRKMADKNQGDRPFYYAEIYVDPANDNLLYSIGSTINRSIDGGRSFDTWIGYWRIHPDHHAFWINPANGQHIINGNDGGLNITTDGGKTWRYADNIPVGQFYHLNVDMERPYNVYGGLQDNGSWVGPSAVWNSSGMRNNLWQEVYFGDGFDVLPQRDNPRYLFAMSQGGNLAHIDRQTGKTREIQPLHPAGERLRWNWNSALAQDPFRDHGIFFGSQMLHYSPDLGLTWKLLSGDLTTNDTSKMHQDKSGGLTLDATNAENHCTIIAIAPSPVQQGVIWVGTDDGQVQLTRDGGKTWENFGSKLPDAPKNAWIPQIEVSTRNAGEAFVVLNNYRQNDWQAYAYHTTDFGKKWRRIASPKNVGSFCLSIVQDPTAPNLLFLGTDQGLYYSLDYGDSWQHWPTARPDGSTVGVFPSVPVQDLKIHPRDGDLVLGTFGRAFWVLDNLAPLRALAGGDAKANAATPPPFRLFEPQEAVLANFASYQGPRFVGDETYIGENKGPHARIPMFKISKKEEKKDDKADKKKDDKADKKSDDKPKPAPKKDKATVWIIDMRGDTIRRFKTEVDTGYTHLHWNLDTKGVRMASNREPDADQLEPGGGPAALPGTYRVVVKIGDHVDSTRVRVIDDPRAPQTLADRAARADATRQFYKTVERANKAYKRLVDAEKTLQLVESQWVNVPDSLKKDAIKLGGEIRDSIAVLKDLYFVHKEGKGIQRNPDGLNNHYWRALGYLGDSPGAPSQTAQLAIGVAERHTESVLTRINALFDNQWKAYRAKAEGVKYSLFKEE
jgi:photosystem II stability/assembly factor-like uncharacterized protein